LCLHADGKAALLPLRRPAISLARGQLDLSLWQSAQEHGATCMERCRIKSVLNDGSEFRLLTDDREFRACTVVNCTGRWSELSASSEQLANSHKKWIGLKGHFY